MSVLIQQHLFSRLKIISFFLVDEGMKEKKKLVHRSGIKPAIESYLLLLPFDVRVSCNFIFGNAMPQFGITCRC